MVAALSRACSCAVVAFCLVSACVQTKQVVCASGRVCPADQACDETHGLCVDSEQLAACNGLEEDDTCTFGTQSGECDLGVCIPTFCGDGVVTGTEDCDGDTLPFTDCTQLGYYDAGNALKCSARCAYDVSACTGQCGDQKRDAEFEWCDGALPDTNDTCVSFGYDAGTIGCSAFCSPGLASCALFSWQQESTAGHVFAIWGVDRDNAVAVGENGLAARWDGSEWQKDATPTTVASQILGAVWGNSDNDIYAVGGTTYYEQTPTTPAGAGSMIHWDGTAWSEVALPAPTATLLGVWVGGGTGFAVGRENTMLRLNGSTWEAMTGPAPGVKLTAVWAASPTDVFVASNIGVHRYNGSTWTTQSLPGGVGHVGSLWGLPSGDVFGVGMAGRAFHFDGAMWRQLATPPCTYELFDVWGTAPDNLYATAWGDFGNGRTMFHYDGSSWSPIASPDKFKVAAVWGTAADDIWIGSYGGVYHGAGAFRAERPFAGGTCNQATSCAWNAATSIAGSSSANVFTMSTASSANVCHYDGVQWNVVAGTDNYGGINAAWVTPSGTAFGVGATVVAQSNCNGTRAVYNFRVITGTGAGFTLETDSTYPHSTLIDVSGIGNHVYAVGARGPDPCTETAWIRHWDGNMWSDIAAPGGMTRAGKIWVHGIDDFYVVGSDLSVPAYRYNAGTWTPLPALPATCPAVRDIHGVGDELLLTCLGGPLFRWNGSAWITGQSHKSGYGVRIRVFALSADDVFVVGGNSLGKGTVMHYTSAAVDAKPTPIRYDGAGIYEMWGTADRLFFVGDDGVASIVRDVKW